MKQAVVAKPAMIVEAVPGKTGAAPAIKPHAGHETGAPVWEQLSPIIVTAGKTITIYILFLPPSVAINLHQFDYLLCHFSVPYTIITMRVMPITLVGLHFLQQGKTTFNLITNNNILF